MPTQTVLLTAVPNGFHAATGMFRVSVVVSPRVITTGESFLAAFDDWHDWPGVARGIDWSLSFDEGPPVALTLVSNPETERWKALFPKDTTQVRGHQYQGLDHYRIYSYPVKHLADFFATVWGKFGASDQEEYPLWDDLVHKDAFKPIGFEDFGDKASMGPVRKKQLLDDLEAQLDPTSGDPGDWAIPFDPNAMATEDGVAKQFLQLTRYHNRGRSDRRKGFALALAPPKLDFHEGVAAAMKYRTLPRLLGLVLDFEFPAGVGRIPTAPDVLARVETSWQPAGPPGSLVTPDTHCTVDGSNPSGSAAFQAIPESAGGDYVERWLRVGKESARFALTQVDVDGAAINAMMFADNLTRSRRDGVPKNAVTPDRYAMPSLSSAGLAVSRVGHGSHLAVRFQRGLDLNTEAVDSNGASKDAHPPLWLDDLVTGHRWDVQHARVWQSLMRQQGTYHFLAQGGAGTVAVPPEEEARTSTSTTSNTTDGNKDDLYAPESLMRWTGWSLANNPIGAALGRDDQYAESPSSDALPDGFQFKATLDVPDGSLPRLRFGEQYSVRARLVDLAGNSEPWDADESQIPDGATERTRYLRYESVQSPLAVPRDPLTAGETSEVVVVRSENVANQAATASARHLLPPRVAQLFAEQHGVLDTDAQGQPLDAAAYALIAERDANSLANHKQGKGDGAARHYPVPSVDVSWLPDPLGKRGVVWKLPPTEPKGGGTPSSYKAIQLDTEAWPAYEGFRLDLAGGPVSRWDYADSDRAMTVTLAQADVFDLRVSSGYDNENGDLDLFGIWQWILAHNPSIDPLVADEGRHWMLTPYRILKVVHAVRTPLAHPVLGDFSAQRDEMGQTFAFLGREVFFHRKSTGRIDIAANWTMNVDDGPGKVDPFVRTFAATAATLTIDRGAPPPKAEGSESLAGRQHEFGDTKHRMVDYKAIATSAFTEFFVQHTDQPLVLAGEGSVLVDDRGLEAETVKVTSADPDKDIEYRQALLGFPNSGDYFVYAEEGKIARTKYTTIADGEMVDVAYVVPEIHTESAVDTQNIPSSARPPAPKVPWVLPTFQWSGDGSSAQPSRKRGSGVRVYLERPWFVSGDGEQLGVVLLPASPLLDPDPRYDPYVTRWGFDPVYKSEPVAKTPTLSSFPASVGDVTSIELPELPGLPVRLALHNVGHTHLDDGLHVFDNFDAGRDLWFCDIDLDFGFLDASYWPFVRLALCRYQNDSLSAAKMSPVVLADFVRVAPDRTVMVIGSGGTRTVTVTGPTSTKTKAGAANQVRITLESKDTSVDDPDLGWSTVTHQHVPQVQTVSPYPPFSFGNHAHWRAQFFIPIQRRRFRFVIEELESHFTGRSLLQPGGPPVPEIGTRVVHTDIVPVT